MTDITRERIRALLSRRGFSASYVSRQAGADRSLLQKYLSGMVKELRDSSLTAVAEVLGVAPAYLRGETDHMGGKPTKQRGVNTVVPVEVNLDVPVVGITEAGKWRPVDWFDDVDLGVVVAGRDPNFPRERQFGFNVEGDSMDDAGINHGDQIICLDPWEANVEIGDGDVVVAERISSGGHSRELTVKELKIHTEGWELCPRSKNPKHKSIWIPRDDDPSDGQIVRIVGIVISVVRRRPVRYTARPAIQKAQKRSKKLVTAIASAVIASAALSLPCRACEAWADPIADEVHDLAGDVTLHTVNRQARTVKIDLIHGVRIQVNLPIEARGEDSVAP